MPTLPINLGCLNLKEQLLMLMNFRLSVGSWRFFSSAKHRHGLQKEILQAFRLGNIQKLYDASGGEGFRSNDQITVCKGERVGEKRHVIF